MEVLMKMSAARFKARCLAVMDEVKKTRVPVVITKRGKPVARLVPLSESLPRGKGLFGFMKGSAEIRGDLVPSSGERWEAESGHGRS